MIIDKYSSIPNQNIIKIFRENNTKEDFSILEIGCNKGHNLKELYQYYPNAKYAGIDINAEAIKKAKENFPQGDFIAANIEDLPFFIEKNAFDYIFFLDVLEHLEQPEKVIEYVKDLLKPDGQIYASIPNLMHWSIMLDLIRGGNFTYTDIGLLDYDHKHLFTFNEILRLFQDHGYAFNLLIPETNILRLPPEFEPYIDKLVEISDGTIPKEQYETYCYCIIASKIDLC